MTVRLVPEKKPSWCQELLPSRTAGTERVKPPPIINWRLHWPHSLHCHQLKVAVVCGGDGGVFALLSLLSMLWQLFSAGFAVVNILMLIIIIIMEIRKAPTLWLKALNKHTHIMFIEMENVIPPPKKIVYIDKCSSIIMQKMHTHTHTCTHLQIFHHNYLLEYLCFLSDRGFKVCAYNQSLPSQWQRFQSLCLQPHFCTNSTGTYPCVAQATAFHLQGLTSSLKLQLVHTLTAVNLWSVFPSKTVLLSFLPSQWQRFQGLCVQPYFCTNTTGAYPLLFRQLHSVFRFNH